MAVHTADDSNFKTLLNDNDKVIVKFYASWCGTCRLMAPKFKRVSEEDDNSDVTFLDVNAEQNEEARSLVGVDNLPFFATFENGELKDSTFTGKFETVEAMLNDLKQSA